MHPARTPGLLPKAHSVKVFSHLQPKTIFLLTAALLVTLGCVGCTGLETDQSGQPAGSQPPQSLLPPPACGATPAPKPYTQQYLYAGDLWQSPTLWAFKIDATTGALSEMPWSPMKTFNGTLSATMDPSRTYLYLSSRAPFGLNHQPIVTLETYLIPIDDSEPQSRGYIEARSSDITLQFDPQGKLFYELSRTGPWEMAAWTPGLDGIPVRSGPATPLNVAWPTTYTYKSQGNLVLVGHGTAIGQPNHSQDGIAVYRQSCATGELMLLKDNLLIDEVAEAGGPNFLNAATNGDLVIAWGAELPVPWFNFPYRVNPVTGVLTSLPDNRIFGLMQTNFDPSGQFAVGRLMTERESDSVAVFRVDPSKGLVETDRFMIPRFNNDQQRILSVPIFELSGSYIYASSSSYLIALKLDRNTGKVIPVAGYPQIRQNSFKPSFIVAH
jgi:hypothetical protein